MGSFAKSTPSRGLELALNMPPLAQKAKEEARMALHRVIGTYPTAWDGLGDGSRRGHLLLAGWNGRSGSSSPFGFFVLLGSRCH